MNEQNSKREVHWEKVEAVQKMQDYIKQHVLDKVLDMEYMYFHYYSNCIKTIKGVVAE